MQDLAKINKVMAKGRSAEAQLSFTVYEHVPSSTPPATYLDFWQFSKINLNAPAVDLYSYQHVLKDIYIASSKGASSIAPASKV
jgi:hypothetical protein